MIVTVTPTVMDGTVVRWFPSDKAEEIGDDVVSASRNGVRVHGYLHAVPVSVLGAAQDAYEALRADNDADVSHLATHRRRGLLGPLVPPAEPVDEAVIMSDKTIEIRGVWLIKEPANLGNHLQVLVELVDGTYKVAIADLADDGPISHYVHPAGILAAPERTFDEETP